MDKKKTFVAKELEASAKTYEKRNEQYGDAYKKQGEIMNAFFPNGVNLEDHSDMIRYGLLNTIVAKLNRYASNFENGGHYDSLHDASVYAAMLNEIDNEA